MAASWLALVDDRGVNRFLAILAAAGLLAAPGRCLAQIDVDLRPATDEPVVGSTLEVGCYLVSDEPVEFCCLSVALGWDPAKLELLHADDTGAAPSQLQFWPPAGAAYTLNESVPPADGDGLYIIMSALGSDQFAEPDGTLVTTFVFEALEAGDTEIRLDVVGPGIEDATIVWDGTTPNTQVTGSLLGAAVRVASSAGDGTGGDSGGGDPSGDASPSPCPDVNGDGFVDVGDVVLVIVNFGTTDAAADVDGDGFVTLSDLLEVIERFGEEC